MKIFTLLLTCFLPICALPGQRPCDKCLGPDNPFINVPPIVYRSPFVGYQAQRPLKLQSWEKANKAVTNTNQPMTHSHSQHQASERN